MSRITSTSIPFLVITFLLLHHLLLGDMYTKSEEYAWRKQTASQRQRVNNTAFLIRIARFQLEYRKRDVRVGGPGHNVRMQPPTPREE
jgi:hypothetical protein